MNADAGINRGQALELLALTLLAAGAAAAIPLSAGYFAWSWDAMNHHVYLGMIAEHPRWDLDVIPANFQSYQYPYLYWPVYRMSLLDGSGAKAGAAWSAFQAAMLMPAVWTISHRLLPESAAALNGRLERIAGCAFAFMSAVVLIGLETSANDLLSAVPLLWAVAIGIGAQGSLQRAFWSAALLGVSIACKFSNGLYIPLLLLWWWAPRRQGGPWRRGLLLAAGTVAGFGLAYAPWGWQLWRVTGNPFYPYLARFFGGA